MKNGILYYLVDLLVKLFNTLNLVELLKLACVRFTTEDRVTAIRFGIDLYIILKWSVLGLAIFLHWTNVLLVSIVCYLMWSNIYTYFYYHVWSDSLGATIFDRVRIKRRFSNLIQAIVFNIVAFAYLIYMPFSSQFTSGKEMTFSDAFLYSVTNSLAANYDQIEPATQFGFQISICETVISFLFFTIILSNSIPQREEPSLLED